MNEDNGTTSRFVHVFQEVAPERQWQHLYDCFRVLNVRQPELFVGMQVCACGASLVSLGAPERVFAVFHLREMC